MKRNLETVSSNLTPVKVLIGKTMSSTFVGTIIEESLEDMSVLTKVKITKKVVEQVTERHKTSWIKSWTLDNVEIPENRASKIAKELRRLLATTILCPHCKAIIRPAPT